MLLVHFWNNHGATLSVNDVFPNRRLWWVPCIRQKLLWVCANTKTMRKVSWVFVYLHHNLSQPSWIQINWGGLKMLMSCPSFHLNLYFQFTKTMTSCCGTPSVFLKAKLWSSWQRLPGGRERRKEWMQSQRDPISKIMNRWQQLFCSLNQITQSRSRAVTYNCRLI